MRLKSILLLCTVFILSLVAHADDASKLEKVHEFFKVAKLDQLSTQIMTQTMQQVNSGMMSQMFGVKLTAEQQKQMDAFSDRLQKVLVSTIGWQSMEPEYAKLYADAYTEQQVDDLLAFYKSPTGQVMVEKSPMLIKESSVLVQQRMAAAMPEIQKLVKEQMSKMTSGTAPTEPSTSPQ